MSALERVARRIGMTLAEVGGEHGPCWVDEVGDYACEPGEAFLRAYLLIQALRIVEAYEMRIARQYGGAVRPWFARAVQPDGVQGLEIPASGPTPAAAIIALAERIEGEGRE